MHAKSRYEKTRMEFTLVFGWAWNYAAFELPFSCLFAGLARSTCH